MEKIKPQPDIDPAYVEQAFNAVINRSKRGAKNNEAKKLFIVFRGNENCGVSTEEVRSQFSHTKDPIKAASSAIKRLDNAFLDMCFDLGVEARRFEGQVTYHLRRRSG